MTSLRRPPIYTLAPLLGEPFGDHEADAVPPPETGQCGPTEVKILEFGRSAGEDIKTMEGAICHGSDGYHGTRLWIVLVRLRPGNKHSGSLGWCCVTLEETSSRWREEQHWRHYRTLFHSLRDSLTYLFSTTHSPCCFHWHR